MSKPIVGAWVFHPGEFIEEEMNARGQTVHDLTSKRWDAEAVTELLAGKRSVDPFMALHLHRLWGVSAELWLNLQEAWDAYPEKQHDGRGQM